MKSPLIHRRIELPEDASPLEILMNHRSQATHELTAAVLWDADSDENAIQKLKQLAESHEFHEIQQSSSEAVDEKRESSEELANIPRASKKVWGKRRRRGSGPQRTPEEIAAIRAERAAKKARLAAEATATEMQ